MANAVIRSAQRLTSAFGRGLEAATRGYDEPGPEIKVAPFERGTVTPSAVALKSIAALIAGRRGMANAREERLRKLDEGRYREAQIRNIESEIKAREVPKVSPRAAVLGNEKALIPFLPGYEASTGTAPINELAPLRTQMAAQTVAGRLERFHEDAKTRAANRVNAVKHYTQAQAALRNLDAEAVAEGERRAATIQQVADQHLAVLQDPKVSVAQRMASAKALGVPQARDPKTGQPIYDPRTKLPLYDSRDAADAVKNLISRARERGTVQMRAAQSARRLALQNVTSQEAGVVAQDAAQTDPMEEVQNLIELYRQPQPQSAESDTSFYDLPAQ